MTDFPICPHCGHEDLDVWMRFNHDTGNGDWLRYPCGQCGGMIRTMVIIEPNADEVWFYTEKGG